MNKFSGNKIVIIIVLYKTKLADCLSYRTLIQNISKTSLEYELILFNNSSNENIENSNLYHIVNSKNNEKLYGAYNYALSFALEKHIKWLLLLDQDTNITEDYFVKLTNYFATNSKNNDIVSIVPYLTENSKILSPQKIDSIGWWQHKISKSGLQTGRITAFNSLSLLSVEFIQSIGGFSPQYPLDMLDHWYYLQIFNNKKTVYVLDTTINHQLSLSNYEENVSFERHLILLLAEKKFTKELGRTHYLTYKIRLTLRFIRQLIFFKEKKYAKVIYKILFNKL